MGGLAGLSKIVLGSRVPLCSSTDLYVPRRDCRHCALREEQAQPNRSGSGRIRQESGSFGPFDLLCILGGSRGVSYVVVDGGQAHPSLCCLPSLPERAWSRSSSSVRLPCVHHAAVMLSLPPRSGRMACFNGQCAPLQLDRWRLCEPPYFGDGLLLGSVASPWFSILALPSSLCTTTAHIPRLGARGHACLK